jgi:hypothetical protein
MTLITLKIELTPQDINDILCTAIEGGINYWCSHYDTNCILADIKTQYTYEIVAHGGYITLYDDYDLDGLQLTKTKLMQGIQQWIDSQTFKPGDAFDIGNIDAGDADCIVQYALFGRLVYC